MRTFGLVLLVVASALGAPQAAKDVKEVKKPRQLQPLSPLVAPQFGARTVTRAPVSYYEGAYPAAYSFPGQGFYPSIPQAYYPSAAVYPAAQPVVPVKKTVKPAVYKAVQPVFAVPAAQAVPVPAAPVVPVPAAVKTTPVQYNSEPFHAIIRQSQDDNFDGSFTSSYETDHGIIVESSGFLKNAGTPDEIQVIQGSYTYYSPEGLPIITTYIADENGFQVQGDHLPVAPPLPQAIAKAIEYQRSLPPSVEDLQGEAVKNQ